MIRQAVAADIAPHAIGPYSQAFAVTGFVFCSGTAAIDPATGVDAIAVRAAGRMAVAALDFAGLTAAVAAEAPPVPARCVRKGRRWQVELGPRTALVQAGVGMLHLAVLIANPGTEIPASDLVAGVAALNQM